MQMLGFAMLILGVVVALYVGFWLLVIFAVVGLVAVAWTHLKTFLIVKGILNPTPGIPPEPTGYENVTIVDADFTRVDHTANASLEKESAE